MQHKQRRRFAKPWIGPALKPRHGADILQARAIGAQARKGLVLVALGELSPRLVAQQNVMVVERFGQLKR